MKRITFELLEERAREFPDDVFINFYDEEITFSEMLKRVNSLASALIRLGIEKGDRVCILQNNSPEFFVSLLGIQRAGAISGPINILWTGEEIRYLLNHSAAVAILVEDCFVPTLMAEKKNLEFLKHVIVLGSNNFPGNLSFRELMDREDGTLIEKRDTAEDDPACIFYTAGTTGRSKGVLLSHKNIVRNAEMAISAFELEDKTGKGMIMLPLFHVNGMMSTIVGMIRTSTIVLRRRFSLKEFWECIERYKIQTFSAVPMIYNILLQDPGEMKHDISSLEFGVCGAAPMPVETFRRFEERFRFPLVEGYGLTEGTCVSTLNPRKGVRKVGSVGIPLEGIQLKITSPEGRELPAGEVGEVCIKGDTVMLGYFRDPEATAGTIRDGWLHTGDMGYLDEDGYLFLTDRKKDMIIRGGENIYPKEVEDVLFEHPKVKEAAVIGVPAPVSGQEVKAFLVLKTGEEASPEEIRDFCMERLAEFKVPKFVEFVPYLPKNAIGKVLKKELRKRGGG